MLEDRTNNITLDTWVSSFIRRRHIHGMTYTLNHALGMSLTVYSKMKKFKHNKLTVPTIIMQTSQKWGMAKGVIMEEWQPGKFFFFNITPVF